MSAAKISNYSEIGQLNTVIIHQPGPEMENMTPETASEVLYDDILTLDLALKEHAQLSGVLNLVADQVLEFSGLLSDILVDEKVKLDLIQDVCNLHGHQELVDDLMAFDAKDLATQLFQGTLLKKNTLEQVKASFAAVEYIDRIEVIPELYTSSRGQGPQLDQLRQLYQLDVLALVSYDQLVNRKENLLAVTYLSIVGNYIFPGSHFDVSTLIDLAVIDLDSKRLLFRAAGTHASKGTSAEAYTRHRYDRHQSQGFASAMHTMIGNLNLALNQFEERLKAKRPGDDIRVEARPGYQMNTHWWMITLLSLVLMWRRSQRTVS
jgi:rhombotail lipoprotein